MPSPFPGMDPWLEHAGLWPDVHNALVAAVRRVLGPLLRPRYFVALEERVYIDEVAGLELVGIPDVSLVSRDSPERPSPERAPSAAVVEVAVPVAGRARETYLEVRGVEEGEVVTLIEVLSPANKRPGEGRRLYLGKRSMVLASLTSLVEIDLLRSGERMPLLGTPPVTDYSVLVSRAWQRPRADLLPFGVRDPVSAFPVPLRRDEEEPLVDLGGLLASVYEEASYDLRVDYRRPPVPPLPDDDARWAEERLAARR